MKKIFFVTYGGGHVNVILPVAEHLKNEYDVTILALTTAKEKCLKAGFRTKTYFDYASREALKIGEEIGGKYHTDGLGFNMQDTIAYYGVNLKELFDKYGVEKGLKLFNDHGRKIFLPELYMEKIIKRENPDIVVTTNSPRSEYAALKAAKKLNIPTVMINDLFGKNSLEKDGEMPLEHLLVPDKICVMHQMIKEKFIKRGIPKNKINVTGQPAFDGLLQITGDDVQKKKDILFASQNTPYLKLIINELLKIDGSKRFNGITIKLHPSQSYSDYQYIEDISDIKVVNGLANIHPLILSHRVILTEFSTVGLEAVLLNRPLVSINLNGGKEITPYSEMRLSYGIENLKELNNILISALENGPTKEATNWKVDGKSNQRIKEVVDNLINLD